MADTQRKLKASEIGYFGQGIPSRDEMNRLQATYAERILSEGYVAPTVREKLQRMNDLHAKATRGGSTDHKAMIEAAELAAELMPILHFKVDDIEWDA